MAATSQLAQFLFFDQNRGWLHPPFLFQVLKSLYSLEPSLDAQRPCCTLGHPVARCGAPRKMRAPAIGLPPQRATCYHHIRYENEKRQECNRLVLAREQKQSVVDTYRTHATDTGSPEVQIALLSERIGQLTEHFKAHQKDHGSRRGLLMMVSRRRSLLDYLKKYDSERYKTVISKLGIRK